VGVMGAPPIHPLVETALETDPFPILTPLMLDLRLNRKLDMVGVGVGRAVYPPGLLGAMPLVVRVNVLGV